MGGSFAGLMPANENPIHESDEGFSSNGVRRLTRDESEKPGDITRFHSSPIIRRVTPFAHLVIKPDPFQQECLH
jgi:hypothetical protein